MKTWRYLVLGLLAANLLLVILRALAPPPGRETPQPPALDPSVPELALVREAYPRSEHGNRCYTLGPLVTMRQLAQAREALEPFADAIRARTTHADMDRGWWVFLPAASRQEALEMNRELGQHQVGDHYVISVGEFANTISLGLFENPENARKHQSRLRDLGFDARVSIRREASEQYWVDYRLPEGARSPWRFLLRTNPGARHVELPCGWEQESNAVE